MFRAAPLQIVRIIQQSCADAARSSSSSVISFCSRGTAAPAYPLAPSRHTSGAPEKSPGFPSSHVSMPTPVVCDPRRGARTSCLSTASSFAACCLLCANSARSSLFCLVRPDVNYCSIVLMASSAIILQRCWERGAFHKRFNSFSSSTFFFFFDFSPFNTNFRWWHCFEIFRIHYQKTTMTLCARTSSGIVSNHALAGSLHLDSKAALMPQIRLCAEKTLQSTACHLSPWQDQNG